VTEQPFQGGHATVLRRRHKPMGGPEPDTSNTQTGRQLTTSLVCVMGVTVV
jgi:hypothetical protein